MEEVRRYLVIRWFFDKFSTNVVYRSKIESYVDALKESEISGTFEEKKSDLMYVIDNHGIFEEGSDKGYIDYHWLDPPQINEESWKSRIDFLFKLPQPEQRTEPWYQMRHNMMTASDIGIPTGDATHGSKLELFRKKCGYGKPFLGNAFTQHGVKYEPVATEIYEFRMGVKVIEFGLIQHQWISFIGASPDGIVMNEEEREGSPPTGTMLEIKCPFKRKIFLDDGSVNIPGEYFAQMQTQMEVTKLPRCDFQQCDINEYGSFEAFAADNDADGKPGINAAGNEKGCLMEYSNIVDNKIEYSYEYCPVATDNEACLEWVQERRKGNNAHAIYWYLNDMSIVPVYREIDWFVGNLPKITAFWEKILHYRSHPDEAKRDLEPKRRKKVVEPVRPKTCLLLDSDSDDD